MLFHDTPLIGRGHERAVVRAWLQAAQQNTGGVALIAGEAGVGKSRLVAEAKAMAAQHGFGILEGTCFPFDHSIPYAPLLDLLRSWVIGRAPEQVARKLGATAPELVKLVPELAARLPGLVATTALALAEENRRLLHALVEFLALQATEQPLLLIIEDLHWSDETTLECLPFLTQHLVTYPVLVLLTYRSDEMSPALEQLAAALARQHRAVEVPLAPLTEQEVDEMLRSLLAQARPVRADFLDAVYSLTEGNPFFIEELVRALIASGDIYYAEARG